MRNAYTYQAVLAVSERVGFRLDDVLPEDRAFDFTRPFLPDALSGSNRHASLTDAERLSFNQICGHTYLCLFGLVEEFILPFVLEHARGAMGEDDRVRALLGFASEEAKHIALFKRFRSTFERGFATRCDVVGPAAEVAQTVLAHSPLAVALAILHIEWMTQRHYVESVHGDPRLEPSIRSLLKHHWIEEAQHAKLDTLMAEAIASGLPQAEVDAGVKGYLSIVGSLDGLLAAQSELDVASLERAQARLFPLPERAALLREHLRALRHTFIGSGMSHPNFLSTVTQLSPRVAEQVRQRAAFFDHD